MTTHQRDLQQCRDEQQRAATALASGTGDVRGLTQLRDDNVMEEALIRADAQDDAWFDEALVRLEADGTPDDVLTCDELGGGE